MIIALWSWTEPIIYSKLTVPRHANRNVWESRMALPEEKAITWSPILASHHITNGQLTTFWNSGSHVCCRAQRTCITDGRGQPSCTVCTVHTEPWTLWEERNTTWILSVCRILAVSAVDTAMSARTLQCPPWMLQCPRFFAKFWARVKKIISKIQE